MLSSNTIKYLRSLQLKKFRQKYNNFVVEGDKIVQEILGASSFEIEQIYALDSWFKTNSHLAELYNNKSITISSKELGRISGLKSPNQVLVVARQLENAINVKKTDNSLSLYLDEIQDPGNMGTIIRTADWFGIQTIFYAPNCVEIYNPKVLQATMGSFLRVNMIAIEFSALRSKISSGIPVYGAVLGGRNLFATDLTQHGIIVIGNEGQGISPEILKHLTYQIEIPAFGKAESLNAAVACGIICAMFRKDMSVLSP